jgi:hypothetical protein
MAFIADTFAVGIAGSAAPWRGEIFDLLFGAGGAAESTVFDSGQRLPLMHAAMLNAYQIHAQEFDCVHERAVVHPMAAVVPALLGWAERDGGISGALLIRATVVAIDVAATLGLCSRAPMRFFRPDNTSGFGAKRRDTKTHGDDPFGRHAVFRHQTLQGVYPAVRCAPARKRLGG